MLKEKINNALDQAFKNLDNSYAPYSNFRVSAACVCKDHTYYGVNIENASFSLTMCAERNAMFSAVTNGENKDSIEAIIIVTKADTITYPCGACRQVMVELLNKDTKIILSNGKETVETTVEKELPHGFTSEDM